MLDLLAAPLLMWRRTRVWAFGVVVAFHVTNAALFEIGIFPWLAIAATTLFFAPDWPHRWRVRPSTAPAPAARATRLGVGAVAVWVVVMLVVPLRHLAYPGDVRWTEEGYRWSWRVLLTEKEGAVTFRVTDPATGRTRTVWPSDELAPHQVRAMSVRPDLIRQYAHHLADEAGSPRPEVRADAWVSLAGLPRARLIDPDVDLAAEPLSLWPADDIEPSPR